MTDGQFLITGDNGLEQSLKIPLSYTAGTNGEANFRFESVWKVQNTNGVGTVTVAWPKGVKNLYLVQSTDQTFATGNNFTPMTAEVTVNGVVYNIANVTLANGQFFTLAGFVCAPGGVFSSAWYRADAASTLFSDSGITVAADNATVQQWNEFNNKPFTLSQSTTTYRPQFSSTTTLVNFNPTVNYDGTQKWMQYDPADAQGYILDRSKGALFSAGNTTSAASSLFGFGASGAGNAMDDPGLYSFTGNKFLFYPVIGEYDPQSTYTINGYYIGGGTWQNGAGTSGNNAVDITLNGFHQTYNTNIQNVNTATTRNALMVGKADAGAQLVGQQNEMIIFPNKLTDIEVNKVESYLAIKYGQTLDKIQNRNYLSSNGSTVWDGTVNNTYYNNVFGIARDNISALYQKQSKSVNANQKLIIGAGNTLFNTNADNTNTLTEGQFLLTGDNGLEQSLRVPLSYTAGTNGEVNSHFDAIWKVQNTNSVGTVTVALPKGQGVKNLYLVQSPDALFDALDTFTPMATEVTVNGVVYNTANVTLGNGQFFTFAGFLENYCVNGCNTNTYLNTSDPNTIEYDNMVSSFHATIIKEADGTFKAWGENSAPNSGSNLSPLAVTPANGYNYTGTPLKATVASLGQNGSQFALLTTDGLYAWGTTGSLLSGVYSSITFGKVTVDGKADGLPPGVSPTDVKMMFGSFGGMAITTCSGEAWVYSITGEKNGDGTNNNSTKKWTRVKTDANTNLTNVVAVRGTPLSLFAQTSDGKLYTWGRRTYINDGQPASARYYATEVALPTGFGTVTPKMIGMTSAASSVVSYYLLDTNNRLFSMGNNVYKQLGDGTTTERTNWVRPQKITNQLGQGIGVLDDIVWISPEEHDGYAASINVLTTGGKQWAWGDNDIGMLGGASNPMDPTYMPGRSTAANGLKETDIIIAVETGGHTTMNIKQCSRKFGYTGHYINGSMGSGSSQNSYIGTYSYSTGTINVCGAEVSAPVVKAELKICLNTTADLSTALLAAPPANTVVEWWTTTTRVTGTQVTNPAAVGTGTYYAFNISTNVADCFDPAYSTVVVKNYVSTDPEYASCALVSYCTTGCNENTYLNATNPNTVEYDNLVAGDHTIIAKEKNGPYKIWGQGAASAGGPSANLFIPTDITSANGFSYTGTLLKATLGGASTSPNIALLTTDGLYTYGGAYLIPWAVKNSNTTTNGFSKITVDGKTDGLPANVAPADVKMMFGSNGSLAIVTCLGEAWTMNALAGTSGNIYLYGDGMQVNTANNNIWHRVQTSATTTLNNVVAVRGTGSAKFALTSEGKLFTWGLGTFIGDGTDVALTGTDRAFATEVAVPNGITPKMIGMTASQAGGKHTYYLLATNGKLYAMGDNTARQLGDGTVTTSNVWKEVTATSGTHTLGGNIAWISPSEHGNDIHPTINVLTNDKKQWGWGDNYSYKLGQTTATTNYDPTYMPGNTTNADGMGLSDEITALETGGRFTMNYKKDNLYFGFVGTYSYGTIGNGTTGIGTSVPKYTYNTGLIDILCAAAAVDADVQVNKIGPLSAQVGSNISYTINVTNNGPSNAGNVIVKDPAVPNFTATSVACIAGAGTLGTATCPASVTVAELQGAGLTIPSLPDGSTVRFIVTGTVGTVEGSVINNVASVEFANDTDLTNNSSTVNTTIYGCISDETTYTIDVDATLAANAIAPNGGTVNMIYKLSSGTAIPSIGNQFTVPVTYSDLNNRLGVDNQWEGLGKQVIGANSFVVIAPKTSAGTGRLYNGLPANNSTIETLMVSNNHIDNIFTSKIAGGELNPLGSFNISIGNYPATPAGYVVKTHVLNAYANGNRFATISNNQSGFWIKQLANPAIRNDGSEAVNSSAMMPGGSYTWRYSAFSNGTSFVDNNIGTASVRGVTFWEDSSITFAKVCATACYKPAAVSGTVLETKHGITALGRAGVNNSNWPMVRKGAWTALESKEKGFVVNRIPTTAALSTIANPIEGMMVYDEEADCLKVYTTKEGDATPGWHCMNTQACPD